MKPEASMCVYRVYSIQYWSHFRLNPRLSDRAAEISRLKMALEVMIKVNTAGPNLEITGGLKSFPAVSNQ